MNRLLLIKSNNSFFSLVLHVNIFYSEDIKQTKRYTADLVNSHRKTVNIGTFIDCVFNMYLNSCVLNYFFNKKIQYSKI